MNKTISFMRADAGRRAQRGFTLAELCTALAVTGLLTALGMPGMATFNGRASVASAADDLSAAIRRARQEAITRGEVVSVCALDPATAEGDEPDCLARGKDWSAGWIVFIDRDQRGTIGANDRMVAVRQATSNRSVVVGTQRYLSFRASGDMLSIAAHLRVLPPGEPHADVHAEGAALVCVNKPGRPRVTSDTECDLD